MNNAFKPFFQKILSMFHPKKSQIMKNLAVFDFDHTVIDDNSDTAVMTLIDKSKFSPELQKLRKAEGWTAFMQGVFQVLHENGITKVEISELVRKIPEVRGMKSLISKLYEDLSYDVIIISDSNTYFIDLWLRANNLSSKVLKVFSNPAEFDESGLLKIEMYHLQESCKLSTKNMCKGMIMEDFIKEQSRKGIVYNSVAYVGDGYNDLCPILRLNSKGLACCREKYKCVDMVRRVKNGNCIDDKDQTIYFINAELCAWESGDDILEYVGRLCN
ncbi:pyridoxal phosphate phosphatase PHOSPHO2-like [Euwallacea similis]|uniref:pyridoxal phosphate phosphatase PHOSPHO2-like n=1 Tax=Euwallacea similis TaxID=1736056 RepID=UPI00344EE7C9